MLGKWDNWYKDLIAPQPYGNTETYRLGAEWLEECETVEDWGCGKGWLRHFIDSTRYRGIDGSVSPFADEIVDLREYRSNVSGIFMRHVLEHNYDWKKILENAIFSFTDRMVLILFTPPNSETKEIAFSKDPGVPDIAFRLEDLMLIFDKANISYSYEILSTNTQYGTETVFYLVKDSE